MKTKVVIAMTIKVGIEIIIVAEHLLLALTIVKTIAVAQLMTDPKVTDRKVRPAGVYLAGLPVETERKKVSLKRNSVPTTTRKIRF